MTMEMSEEKVYGEDGSQMNRSRNIKSKQLVRSQAIRESQSPPLILSPAMARNDNEATAINMKEAVKSDVENASSCVFSHFGDKGCNNIVYKNGSVVTDDVKKKLPVEIQITSGAWDGDPQPTEQKQRTKLWLGHRNHSDSSRDLLSKSPRVACVCGNCSTCPHCRGRRRKIAVSPTKQDPGIVCSADCSDCSGNEQPGNNSNKVVKSNSLDVEDPTYYCRCPERKDKPKTMSLSRTESEEKAEPTGTDLVTFIKDTLNKNARDRMTLFKIERELYALINDPGRCIIRFPVMTSYGRMLVHRCASLFQLSHHLDQNNKTSVVVSKGTSGGRIPCTTFKQWCTTNFPYGPYNPPQDSTNAKSILKRDTQSQDDGNMNGNNSLRSKSLEQRERDYELVRRRIFSSDNCTQDESQWPWLNSGNVKVLTSTSSRNKLLKVQSLETPQAKIRGAVAKSHSFGGYGDTQQARVISKHGDLASSSWRVSSSSSGYKTLSMRSTDSVTPSPVDGATPEPASTESQTVVWAVTDMSVVPKGALVIHPQTGRPLKNPDGSIYHFDPSNPPNLGDVNFTLPIDEPVKEKRKSRLEKQHSVVENENVSERTKCRDTPSQENNKNNAPEKPKDTEKEKEKEKEKNSTEHPLEVIPFYNLRQSGRETIRYSKTKVPVPEKNNKNGKENSTDKRQGEVERPVFDYETIHNPILPVLPTSKYQLPLEIELPPCHPILPPSQSMLPPQPVLLPAQPMLPPPQHVLPLPQPIFPPPPHEPKQWNESKDKHKQSHGSRTKRDNLESHHGYHKNVPMPTTTQMVPNNLYMQPQIMEPTVVPRTDVPQMPVHDPNMRPMSMTNVMYPPQIPVQNYPCNNPCRMDQPLQPVMYHHMVPVEEPKQHLPPPTHPENTFRIDPTYPYPVEYGHTCSLCVDSNIHHQSHRSYNPYGQVEMPAPVLPNPYPVNNVIIPQPHVQTYSYPEQMAWQNPQTVVPIQPAAPKFCVPELYPVYPNVYPQYNVVYKQMVPSPYGIGQPNVVPPGPVPVVSSTSQRETPRQTPASTSQMSRPPHNYSNQGTNDISVKVRKTENHMTNMSTKDKEKSKKPEDSRRNNGHGILGNPPIVPSTSAGTRSSGRNSSDDTQLTTAAPPVVGTLLNLPPKNIYNTETRKPETQYPQRVDNRNRQRPETRPEPQRDPNVVKNDSNAELMQRRLNAMPYQFRPPYWFRQMPPAAWYRRSDAPLQPVYPPRRTYPDPRNQRR